jgi:hypothetical protein
VKWAALPGTEAYNQNLKNVPSAGYAIAAGFSVVQMYFDTP